MRVAFFDVVGTLVDGNPWRGLIQHPSVNRARVLRKYPLLLALIASQKPGLIPDTRFRQIWIRQMASLLRGMTRDETITVFRWVAYEWMAENDHRDVVERLQTHKQQGDFVLLISGMFADMTQQFAERFGADAGTGTQLAFEDGVCTGRIVGDGCAGDLKPQFAQRYLGQHKLDVTLDDCYAYADSFSDVPLLSWVGHAVVTRGDSDVRTVAAEQGWEIIQ